MSGKNQFLKKFQIRQSPPDPCNSKCQADIVEFRLRTERLHEQLNWWLAETGLQAEMFTASVTDLLVEDGAFDMSGIVLRYDTGTHETFMAKFNAYTADKTTLTDPELWEIAAS